MIYITMLFLFVDQIYKLNQYQRFTYAQFLVHGVMHYESAS